jgi:hypothetical protein
VSRQINATRHTTYASPTRSGLGRWHGAAWRFALALSLGSSQTDSSVRPNEHALAPFSAPVPIWNVSSERVPFDSVNFVPFGTSILMWTSGLGRPDWDVPKGRASRSGRAGADPPHRGAGRHRGRSARPPVRHRACVTSAKVASQSPGTRSA